MREKKWTPGPWKLTDDIPPNVYGEYKVDIKAGAQPMVAMTDINECPSCSNIFYGPEQMVEIEANAALISAAPELVAELENADRNICIMCRIINSQHEKCTSCPEREDRLAALAKAYGESDS